MLQKQNSDLRTRLSNLAAKHDLKVQELLGQIALQKKEMGEMPNQITMLQEYIAKLEGEIIDLKAEIKTLKSEAKESSGIIAKLRQSFNKLLAKYKKNSSTSDKPPSANPFVKAKSQSLREKSGKKPGGQIGHKGHGPKLFKDPSHIIEKKPCACEKCGGDVEIGEKYIRRQLVDLEIKVSVTEERVFSGVCRKCEHVVSGQFDDEYKGPLQYGVNMKSLIALLNEYGCISDSRTAEIVNSISGDILSISWGTIVNIRKELSEKLEATINNIRELLIVCEVLNADETSCRVNGKLNWIHVFCNSSFTLYGTSDKRGDFDDSVGILAYFVGILIHDHFLSYYKHEAITHGECNEHILRYLKGLAEIFKHTWVNDMSDLLKNACHDKNELLRANKTEMPLDDIKKFSNRYDEILKQGWAEYILASD